MTDPEADADAAFSFQAKIVVYFNGSLGNICFWIHENLNFHKIWEFGTYRIQKFVLLNSHFLRGVMALLNIINFDT